MVRFLQIFFIWVEAKPCESFLLQGVYAAERTCGILDTTPGALKGCTVGRKLCATCARVEDST